MSVSVRVSDATYRILAARAAAEGRTIIAVVERLVAVSAGVADPREGVTPKA